MAAIEERLSQIEDRLSRLEQLFLRKAGAGNTNTSPTPSPQPNISSPASQQNASVQAVVKNKPGSTPEEDTVSITQVLGWTGATALVLAAAYLIRLALDAGWLTPQRQLALAVLSGLSLIFGGLALRKADRSYSSLLPAGGLVILFLSIYGAHLYYHFIGAQSATALVIITCLATLWLGSLFETELYGLFAVVGSYSAPFLLSALHGQPLDLAIYFSAWSIVFCVYSIKIGQRRAYLLAAYLGLLGFHLLWQGLAPQLWQTAFLFQLIQFAIFLAGAIAFSILRERPMSQEEALAHLPLLLIFYALQYNLLQQHLPDYAPWIAIGSAATLLLMQVITKNYMQKSLESSTLLVGGYISLVLFHAGYMELLPQEFAPWLSLLLLPALWIYFSLFSKDTIVIWPVRILVGIIFFLNYLRSLAHIDMDSVPGHQALALIYAIELYASYYFAQSKERLKNFTKPVLYTGHLAAMSAAVQIFDNQLLISLSWGALAIACLTLAFKFKDKLLGKSSLLIFAASVAKVLLHDISAAPPLIRIASLVVLGLTLYLGGWMYKKVDTIETT